MKPLLALTVFGLFALASSVLALMAYLFAELAKDLFVTEARTRLERLPFAVLALARRRLPEELREVMHDNEWLPELLYVVRCTEGLPLTRFLRGMSFALNLLLAARRIGREVCRDVTTSARPRTRLRGLRLVLLMCTAGMISVGLYGYFPVVFIGLLLDDVRDMVAIVTFGILAAISVASFAIIWVSVVEALRTPSLWRRLPDRTVHFTSMWAPDWWDDEG